MTDLKLCKDCKWYKKSWIEHLIFGNDAEILQLVKEHFTEEWCEEDGCGWTEFAGTPDAFVKFVKVVLEKNDFYKTRCELLQKVQKYMRDPERQIVCDILANNDLLPDPSGVRYGQDLKNLIGL